MNPANNRRPASQQLPAQPQLSDQDEYDQEDDDQMYVDYVNTFGRKTKPRYLDPSMFELMQWRDADAHPTFKSSKDALRDMDDYRRYKALVDRSSDGFTTEAKDNYRKFAYKKLEDAKVHIPFENTVNASHDKSIQNVRPKSGQQRRVNPEQASEYIDQISSKYDENYYRHVMETVQQNEAERQHLRSKSASRDRRPYSGNFKRSEMLDWPDGDEMRKIRQQEKEDLEAREVAMQEEIERKQAEEEERLKELQQADYSKVQNRLLSYKVNKRRELDPVKDKEKIARRDGRIKVSPYYGRNSWSRQDGSRTQPSKPTLASLLSKATGTVTRIQLGEAWDMANTWSVIM